ncbi:hypothetical protein Tsubulata_013626 [Turnera subulata]|uniref:Uncharacterized protein n=1 Tax=Turnera subulata TaxID=218843 RepID=A0A9Q0F7U0_9ROSI|nr:hypothetical protein Tsubulata_013626 [Turnera subulata]
MCMVFDITDPTKNLKEKEIKRQTLLELVDYVTSPSGKFTETITQEVIKMVSAICLGRLPLNLVKISDQTPAELVQVCWLEGAFGSTRCPVFLMAKVGNKGRYKWDKLDLLKLGLEQQQTVPADFRTEITGAHNSDPRIYFGLYEVWSADGKNGSSIFDPHHPEVCMIPVQSDLKIHPSQDSKHEWMLLQFPGNNHFFLFTGWGRKRRQCRKVPLIDDEERRGEERRRK